MSEYIFGPSETAKRHKRERAELIQRVDAINDRLRTVVYPEVREAQSDIDAYKAMDIEEKKNTDESKTLANVSERVIRQVKAKRRFETADEEKKTLQKAKDQILSDLAGQTSTTELTKDQLETYYFGKLAGKDEVTADLAGISIEELQRRRSEMRINDDRVAFAGLTKKTDMSTLNDPRLRYELPTQAGPGMPASLVGIPKDYLTRAEEAKTFQEKIDIVEFAFKDYLPTLDRSLISRVGSFALGTVGKTLTTLFEMAKWILRNTMKFKVIQDNLGLIILGGGMVYYNWDKIGPVVMPILRFVGGLIDGFVNVKAHEQPVDDILSAALNATVITSSSGNNFVKQENFKSLWSAYALMRGHVDEKVEDTMENLYNAFLVLLKLDLPPAASARTQARINAHRLVSNGFRVDELKDAMVRTGQNVTQFFATFSAANAQYMRQQYEEKQIQEFVDSPWWWMGKSFVNGILEYPRDFLGIWNYYRSTGQQWSYANTATS